MEMIQCYLKCTQEAGEMAGLLSALTALAKDLASIPSSHTGQLTIACNSSSMASDTLFPPSAGTCMHVMHIHTYHVLTYTCTYIHALGAAGTHKSKM